MPDNALPIARRKMGVGGEDGETIGRRDETPAADDEIAVAVAVGRGAKIGRGVRHGEIVKMLGVHEVRVGVMSAEIGQGIAIDDASLRRAQRLFQDRARIRAGDRRHGVEFDRQAGAESLADAVEVEQRLHQRAIICDAVDDLDAQGADLRFTEPVDIDVFRLDDLEGCDLARAGVDRLGDLLGRRAAVGDIIFDAKVAVRAAWVVTRREHDPAEGFERADKRRDGRRRQNAALADHDAAEAVGGGDLQNGLDRFAIEVAAVPADDERLALIAFKAVENRLDEILEVMALLENRDFLSQARSARTLIDERRGGDRLRQYICHLSGDLAAGAAPGIDATYGPSTGPLRLTAKTRRGKPRAAA